MAFLMSCKIIFFKILWIFKNLIIDVEAWYDQVINLLQ